MVNNWHIIAQNFWTRDIGTIYSNLDWIDNIWATLSYYVSKNNLTSYIVVKPHCGIVTGKNIVAGTEGISPTIRTLPLSYRATRSSHH